MQRSIFFLHDRGRNNHQENIVVNLLNCSPSIDDQKKYNLKLINWEKDILENSEWLPHYFPSVLMRFYMQANLYVPFAPKGYSLAIVNNYEWIKNSIVILHKNLKTDPLVLIKLKNNGNLILLDTIDDTFPIELENIFDGLFCCSVQAYNHYKKELTRIPTFFLGHCVDSRLQKVKNDHTTFASVYFGAPENLLLPDQLRPSVDILYSDNSALTTTTLDWINKVGQYSFHYAVRPPKNITLKPFTKGFIAAQCRANILVHKDDGDAEFFLGSDYPYLIKEPLSDKVITEYFEKAKYDFGGEVWNRGIAIMEELQKNFREEVLAKQFWRCIASIEG